MSPARTTAAEDDPNQAFPPKRGYILPSDCNSAAAAIIGGGLVARSAAAAPVTDPAIVDLAKHQSDIIQQEIQTNTPADGNPRSTEAFRDVTFPVATRYPKVVPPLRTAAAFHARAARETLFILQIAPTDHHDTTAQRRC